jgi:glycosyltransferase involved in cell wall biosynthesis
LGHDVTLFASADSTSSARLVPVRDQALRRDPEPLKSELASHLSLMARLRQQADQFDIIHFHTDMIHFPFFETLAARSLTTMHGRLDMKDLALVYRTWRKYPLVSISRSQRKPLANAHWVENIFHGIPADLCRFTAAPRGNYLAFIGRLAPDKRPDRAIAIAKRAGMTLKIAAKIDPADRTYFREHIAPLLDDPMIEFIGEISDPEKSAFLGNATALLFPIDWPEPFGLVMIEAMACGTPVIAWPCGSVPEIIEPGVTGMIVNSVASAAEAVGQVARFGRSAIRAVFDARFTAEVMANRHVALYQRQLAAISAGRLPTLAGAWNASHVAAFSAGP